MKQIFGILIVFFLCARVALAKESGVLVRIGGGGGAGSGALTVAEGDAESAYAYRAKTTTAWLQIGKAHNTYVLSDFGFFGTRQLLKSDYTEESIVGRKTGRESISVMGGGLLYSLTILLGERSEAAIYSALGVGRFSGKLSQSGDTPLEQSYSGGVGGTFSLGLLLGTGGGGARPHFEFLISGESVYTSLTGGSDDAGNLSNLYMGTVAWQLALSFKI